MMAVRMPDLIAHDDAGYAQIVETLYHDRERLARLRQALVTGRSGEQRLPLFDMKQFAADMETRLVAMVTEKAKALS